MSERTNQLFDAMEAAARAVHDHWALVRQDDPREYDRAKMTEAWVAEHRALTRAQYEADDAFVLSLLEDVQTSAH